MNPLYCALLCSGRCLVSCLFHCIAFLILLLVSLLLSVFAILERMILLCTCCRKLSSLSSGFVFPIFCLLCTRDVYFALFVLLFVSSSFILFFTHEFFQSLTQRFDCAGLRMMPTPFSAPSTCHTHTTPVFDELTPSPSHFLFPHHLSQSASRLRTSQSKRRSIK